MATFWYCEVKIQDNNIKTPVCTLTTDNKPLNSLITQRIINESKTKSLKGTFANKEAAQRAADAEMAKIKREMATFSITMAIGIPEVSTESPVKLDGFKKQLDALNWIVAKAVHSYSDSGLTTQLEMESVV